MSSSPIAPRRVVAILLTAVAIAGLAFMRAGRDPDPVTVPAGARAGQLDVAPCTYDGLKADCGTIAVPENRGDPQSRLIALPVTRVRAERASPKEPIFRLGDGPGTTSMEFPRAGRIAKDRDVVLVGRRGVDGSARLDCPEVAAAMKKPRDLHGAAARREIDTGFRDCEKRLSEEGVDLAGYTDSEREADVEDVRRALGYDEVDVIGERGGRLPWNAFRRVSEVMPDRWMGLPIHPGNVRIASSFGLEAGAAAPLDAPTTIDAWAAAGRGDASGLWAQSLLANVFLAQERTWGDLIDEWQAEAVDGAEPRIAPAEAASATGITQTAIGKIIAGVLVGLPIAVAIGLAAIARRTRSRGTLRTWASATTRTAFAGLGGLAGWMLAVVAVLVTSAPIAFDDPTLVMVAVALPVAAAVHVGWVNHGRTRRMRMIGFAAAVAGAIVGARLGYGVAADFAELWTAILGSVAGANAIVIARDVWAGDDPVGA